MRHRSSRLPTHRTVMSCKKSAMSCSDDSYWFHGFYPARVRKSLALKILVSAAD